MSETTTCHYCGQHKQFDMLNVPSADRTKRIDICGDHRAQWEAERKQWLAEWQAAHPKPVKKAKDKGAYYNEMATLGAFLGANKKGGK